MIKHTACMKEFLIPAVFFADMPLITTIFKNSFINLEMPEANIIYIGVLLCSLANFCYHCQDILRTVVSRFSIRVPFCIPRTKFTRRRKEHTAYFDKVVSVSHQDSQKLTPNLKGFKITWQGINGNKPLTFCKIQLSFPSPFFIAVTPC